MNFFEQQDRARRLTRRLVFLFVISVILILISVNLAAYFIVSFVNTYRRPTYRGFDQVGMQYEQPQPIPPMEIFVVTSGITLLIIFGGNAYKAMALSGGGPSVAELLGGRPLMPNAGRNETMLQNVVEEMAIASGVPVPRVYLLDREEGINAFAAGFGPNDTIIGVTYGALTKLNRDELQGVIGHEFSHILNGDVHLDLRLVSWLHGILVISLTGLLLMRSLQLASFSGRRRDDNGGAVLLGIFLLGAAVYVIGGIGMVFGRLIQAAVSRQREYLADASAVQFTRNPAGLVGALKKLGQYSSDSKVQNPQALGLAHLFFANSSGFTFAGLLATHPPLVDRIRALDPTFDGKFDYHPPPSKILERYDGKHIAIDKTEMTPLAAMNFTYNAARPNAQHLTYAAGLLATISDPLTAAARDPFSARALVFALLMAGSDQETFNKQLPVVRQAVEPGAADLTPQLLQQVKSLTEGAKLPLFELTLSGLQKLSPQQAESFKRVVRALIQADGKVTLFEYALFRMLEKRLGPQVTAKPPIEFFGIGAVQEGTAVILSALAAASSADTLEAFKIGARQLDPQQNWHFVDKPSLTAIDAALQKLSRSSPAVKKRIIDASACTVAADGQVSVAEAQLLRAIAATLDVPMPPLLTAPPAH